MTSYIPRHEEIQGSDLSGSDGAINRTYSLVHSSPISAHMQIIVDGAILQSTVHYTLSGQTVTFLQAVFDNQEITIDYWTSSSGPASTTSGSYVTTLELNEFMSMWDYVPAWKEGNSPGVEQVTASVGSDTVFYLDRRNVISGTLSVYYGATSTSTTTMTEDTDYSVDLDRGKVTLTATGQGAASASALFAEYKVNTLGFSDSYLRTALDRAQKRIESRTNTKFFDGTDTEPAYELVTKEYLEGKGEFRRDYFLQHYPVADIRTELSSAAVTADTTFSVDSTSGFPNSGTAAINGEQFTWTGKTSTTLTGVTRGANGTSASAHAVDDEIRYFIVETSLADEGESNSWDTLKPVTEFSIDYDSGRIRLMKNLLGTTSARVSGNLMPIRTVPKRFRVTYPYGNDTVPEDIKQVNLMLASNDLIHQAVRKAHSSGKNQFDPALVNVDREWIDEILEMYRSPHGELI